MGLFYFYLIRGKQMAYTVEEVREHLLTDDRWLLRGLLAIYARQTTTEKETQSTRDLNGVGFNGVDAPFLSDIAQKYTKYGSLSNKQIAAVRRCMNKYSAQLTRIANKEE
jgi:hypothetical protein